MGDTDDADVASKLNAATTTNIAALSPDLAPNNRVRGVTTIIWPFSLVKGTFAFILAEPDFRLRLKHGQVRINFTGLAAAAVGNCGLESQDEIELALHGAKWSQAATNRRQSVSGADIDYQITFSEEVVLKVSNLCQPVVHLFSC